MSIPSLKMFTAKIIKNQLLSSVFMRYTFFLIFIEVVCQTGFCCSTIRAAIRSTGRQVLFSVLLALECGVILLLLEARMFLLVNLVQRGDHLLLDRSNF